MYLKVNSVPPQEPTLPDQPTAAQAPPKRSKLKLNALFATVLAVAIIIVALLAAPSEATIPLSVNYQVGEKMVYDANISMEMQTSNMPSVSPLTGLSPGKISTNATITTDVLSFDGETYTLNQTTTIDVLGTVQSIALTQRVNKTGFSTYMINSPASSSSYSLGSNAVLNSLLDKPDVKVGESVQVSMPGLKGNLTLTFGGIKDITVPAGTYKAYKVSLSGDNLSADSQIPQELGGSSIQVSMSMNGEMYIEYGTGRQIQCSMQSTTTSTVAQASISMDMAYQMTLTQHILAK